MVAVVYCVQELLQFWELGMSGRGQRDRDVRVMGVILEASRGPVSVEHRWPSKADRLGAEYFEAVLSL